MTTPERRLSPDITHLTAFLRARWAEERANAAAYRNGHDGADNCWGLHTDPTDINADLDAKEALLADLLAEKHLICGDSWYTCCAAARQRDGDDCAHDDTDHTPGKCTCGLTERTTRRLHILAAPYTTHSQHPDHTKAR